MLFRPEINGNAIRRVLIANRGEIAVRLIETLNFLNIESIAIYSDSDAESPHVDLATRSVFIGSAQDGVSPYLAGDKIIALALELEADAIHPGTRSISRHTAPFCRYRFRSNCAKTEQP